jgi:hypothetical protein
MITATEINEGTSMTKGGKRSGAGRPKGKPTFTIRMSETMRCAAEALARIGRGEGTQVDVAELMLAANASDKMGYGIVGAEEITKALHAMKRRVGELREDGKWEEADEHEARADDLMARYVAVQNS